MPSVESKEWNSNSSGHSLLTLNPLGFQRKKHQNLSCSLGNISSQRNRRKCLLRSLQVSILWTQIKTVLCKGQWLFMCGHFCPLPVQEECVAFKVGEDGQQTRAPGSALKDGQSSPGVALWRQALKPFSPSLRLVWVSNNRPITAGDRLVITLPFH